MIHKQTRGLRVLWVMVCLAVAVTGCGDDSESLDLQAAVDAEVAAIEGGGRYVEPTTLRRDLTASREGRRRRTNCSGLMAHETGRRSPTGGG